jgi:hypothetical protein
MNHQKLIVATIAVVAVAVGITSAHAAVSEEEAKQLGGPVLTAFGAEKAGNKEGTIPAYTGTGPKTPTGWVAKDTLQQRPDPYGDKPLFSISAENAAQYADKLDGMVEMFKRYPNFRMDIYPTHRDYRMPQHVLDKTVKNATACKAVDRELKLEGCYGGMPFPIPKTGNQTMWNHIAGYQIWTVKGRAEAWVVPTEGAAVLVDRVEYINNWPGFDPAKNGPLPSDSLFFRYIGTDEAPARLAGGKFMILDPFDWVGVGRRAYLYATGRRWVKLAANLAYDTPTPYGAGTATMDDQEVFMGALDRFDFELVGKKEKYIYYDNYQFTDRNACSTEKIHSTKNFPNPDCVRWELHRVWVVKAKLKPEFKHLYSARVFYWDEDGFQGGSSESYDAKGRLIRFAHNVIFPYFETPGMHSTSNNYIDLQSGVWATSGTETCPTCGEVVVTTPLPDDTFLPDAMAGSGIR